MHGWMSGWDWAWMSFMMRCGDGPCRREAGEPGADRSTAVVRELLFIALILACPLMMIWMMRGHARRLFNEPPGRLGCAVPNRISPIRSLSHASGGCASSRSRSLPNSGTSSRSPSVTGDGSRPLSTRLDYHRVVPTHGAFVEA